MNSRQLLKNVFIFQGNPFYTSVLNLSLMKYTTSSIDEWDSVFNSKGVIIGDITWKRNVYTGEIYKQILITSKDGHEYTYNLETEKLIHFQHAIGWNGKRPTDEELANLDDFRAYVARENFYNNNTGVFHILELEDPTPEPQIEVILK